MRKGPMLMAGALFLAGCSAPEQSSSRPEDVEEWSLDPNEEFIAPTLADPEVELEPKFRTAVQSGRIAVRIVVVPVNGQDYESINGGAIGFKKFIAMTQDQSLLDPLEQAFSEATYGRVEAEVSAELHPTIDLLGEDCLSSDSDQLEQHQQISEIKDESASNDPNEIVVMAIGAAGCLNTESSDSGFVSGYASYNTDPPYFVMSATGTSSAERTLVHESGHSASLPHAGSIECEAPAELTDCKSDPTGDLSVMGYRDGEKFSTPDMYHLELLKPHEVRVISAAGSYELTAIDNDPEKDDVKLLTYKTAAGKQLFISYEPDERGDTKVECAEDGTVEIPEGSVLALSGSLGTGPRIECYVVQFPSVKHSLQLRVSTEEDRGAAIVLPKYEGHELAQNFFAPWGTTAPNTVIYKDSEIEIIFNGHTEAGSCALQVNRLD